MTKSVTHKAAKFLIFQSDIGMIEFRTSFSTYVKTSNMMIDATSRIMMKALFHPYSFPLESTKESKISPEVESPAPRKSRLGFKLPSWRSSGR